MLSEEMVFKSGLEELVGAGQAQLRANMLSAVTAYARPRGRRTLDLSPAGSQWGWGEGYRALAGCCMERMVGLAEAGRPMGRLLQWSW